MSKLLFLDIEATGVDAEDRLVEVGYCSTEDFQTWAVLFKAPLPVKLAAMSINNITNEMLEGKEPFEGSIYQEDLRRKSQDHILVAHNAIYDLDMLKKEGIEFSRHICTLKIAHFLDEEGKMEKHTLSYLRYYLHTNVIATPHTATGDIVILQAVFEMLKDIMRVKLFLDSDEEVIEKMVEISKNPILIKKFTFGKYVGLTLTDVAQDNCFDKKGRSYMQWLLSEKINNPQGQEADWIYSLNYYLQKYESSLDSRGR